MIRRTRIAPISERGKKRNAEYAKAKRQWRKAHQVCEACEPIQSHLFKAGHVPRQEPELEPWATRYRLPRPADNNPHHSRGRTGILLCHTPLWIAVCQHCHDWIHNHPREAREILSTCGVPLFGPWQKTDDIA